MAEFYSAEAGLSRRYRGRLFHRRSHYNSENPKAPVYRLFAKSPRGKRIEIGGIWKKQNQSGGDYYTWGNRGAIVQAPFIR
ncbi:DUF736 family protein [Rhizobium leguminosarum bv. viciae]|nr:DUF736 family protein [Rhizobium leguminosarum bv. viciae]NKL60192.1 DUF736 family protein [Rhizobium leguminosarum bv. viciae]